MHINTLALLRFGIKFNLIGLKVFESRPHPNKNYIFVLKFFIRKVCII